MQVFWQKSDVSSESSQSIFHSFIVFFLTFSPSQRTKARKIRNRTVNIGRRNEATCAKVKRNKYDGRNVIEIRRRSRKRNRKNIKKGCSFSLRRQMSLSVVWQLFHRSNKPMFTGLNKEKERCYSMSESFKTLASRQTPLLSFLRLTLFYLRDSYFHR